MGGLGSGRGEKENYSRGNHKVPEGTNMALKNLSASIPKTVIANMELLIKWGFYPSKSEIVRTALHDFFVKELDFIQKQKSLHTAVIEDDKTIRIPGYRTLHKREVVSE